MVNSKELEMSWKNWGIMEDAKKNDIVVSIHQNLYFNTIEVVASKEANGHIYYAKMAVTDSQWVNSNNVKSLMFAVWDELKYQLYKNIKFSQPVVDQPQMKMPNSWKMFTVPDGPKFKYDEQSLAKIVEKNEAKTLPDSIEKLYAQQDWAAIAAGKKQKKVKKKPVPTSEELDEFFGGESAMGMAPPVMIGTKEQNAAYEELKQLAEEIKYQAAKGQGLLTSTKKGSST